jgi:hypothetical protein
MSLTRRRWFTDAQLLPAERLLRSAPARLRIPGPPYWWEGELFLTSDRLFFLPRVEHPRLGATAFWLRELAVATGTGRNRIGVRAGADTALFQLTKGPAGIIGNSARTWLAAIAAAQPAARTSSEFRPERRRAAG